MTVGICGKYCSGKNEAARVFAARGYRIIDVDGLGHEAHEGRKEELTAAFGEGILAPDGSVSRGRLGRLVFGDRRKLRLLEEIVHPYMVERVKQILSETSGPAVINAALLFPMGLHTLCDRIIVVRAPLPARIRRALERDKLGLPAVLRRIWAQRKLIPQSYLLPADTIIVENSGTRKDFGNTVSDLASRLSD